MNGATGVPSPCVNICRMDEARGLCVGCLRTLDEIARWSTMHDDDKRAVWARLVERRSAASTPAMPNSSASPPGDAR